MSNSTNNVLCDFCKKIIEDKKYYEGFKEYGDEIYNTLHYKCLGDVNDMSEQGGDFSAMHPDETEEEFFDHEDFS